MKTLPVITIGHVDHGKTSLVRALTGIDTDTLPEEKIRGVSIALGFAHRVYDDTIVDFIDAPGHENFINAMVSGASGAQAALLVIAANEGIKPQTSEHLQIAKYFGLTQGIIALTKSDLLPTEDHAARKASIRAALTDTCLATAPIIFCSAQTGQGLDALNTALANLTSHQTAQPPASYFPIDRVFTAEGRGTIVTGTLLGAPITADTHFTHSPSNTSITLRALQTHGQDTPQATEGQRTALNLRNTPATKIKRGDILHTPNAFTQSLNIDVQINLANTSRPLKHMAKVRILFASANAVATLRLYDGNHIAPGTSALAQLRFETPITTYAGQRAILRNLSPTETLGGLTILDPAATAPKNKPARRATLTAAQSGDPAQIATALANEHAGIAQTSDLARLSRQPNPALSNQFTYLTETTITPTTTLITATNAYLERLTEHHKTHPLKPTAPCKLVQDPRIAPELTAHIETSLAATNKIHLTQTHTALTTHHPENNLTPTQQSRANEITTTYKTVALNPPPPDSLNTCPEDEDLQSLLIHSGTLIRLHNVSLNQALVFHADALRTATQTLATAFPNQTPFKTGEARAALNTTRKYIVPILEHFDAQGITKREGDIRHIA